MSRSQRVVLIVFFALVGCFGALVGPTLFAPRRRAPRTPDPTTSIPRDPRPPPPPSAPPPAVAVDVARRVTTASGAVLDAAAVRFLGARAGATRPDGRVVARRVAPVAWVGAAGAGWAPWPGAQDEITLPAAGPAATVTVVEPDGTPAPDVAVLWPGPDGRPLARRTDERGVVVVDDAPEGLLVLSVGGSERAGPTLRLRIGPDREARAVLGRPLEVAGRVLDRAGAPVVGCAVEPRTPAGPAGRAVRTAQDGTFRVRARATDRLALVARADDGRCVAVEPPMPAATGPYAVAADLVLPAAAASVPVTLDRRALAADAVVRLSAEPSALALVREAFGDDALAWTPAVETAQAAALRLVAAGFDGPVRVQVEGDVTPEDHLVPAVTLGDRTVALVPRPAAAPAPAPAPAGSPTTVPPGPDRPATLHGFVRDAAGAPLDGVTVAVGRRRTVSDAQGRYALDGLAAGERVDVVFGWVDGARPSAADPRPFAPWAISSEVPGERPVGLVLPKAAGVRLRALRGLDGTPLSWVRAVVLDGAGSVRADEVLALDDGRGTLEGLVPGTPGTLTLLAPGLRREVPLALRAGETVDAGDVSLVAGVRVEGTVVGPDGAPVAGATVALADDGRGDGGGRGLVRERDLALRRTTTDAAGAFVLEGLDPARPALLAACAPGLAPTMRRAEPGGATSLSLVRGASFRVRVEDPRGAAVVGAVVELRDARSGARWLELLHRAAWGSVVGSSDDLARATEALWTESLERPGSHRVGPAEPGPYDVLVMRPGYRPSRARFTVAPGKAGSTENPLGLPVGEMEWRVVLEPEPDAGASR